ncbi:MAG TPA: Asp-tRNA(Asn)/Glu-tRNA(Gln) amidotransferase subunit GatB [Fimbriimonadaceae bacterium]|nr:Asp-tRNA(Asn)/Glu-tRNA(Gln) amidotransferase subunit GatB [Fimbriimonadaceae bacterium]HRJ32732.1 Asp-tRNA(Asn)/Glu-tRNA(Gln) amidotransferase subunit GatB [Fimbriimonadaceae bacterium]
MPEYVLSVGMEVHAELLTQSKMFCRCPVAFGGEPNTRVCPVCLGLPGTLPVPNRRAIELVMKTALALNCTIARHSVFHRKNYFYPDLPKGYQVSQYGETNPIGYGGFLEIPTAEGGFKRIGIRRVHLEEDTGKLMHLPSGGSGIDYNRAGVPLMEIVTDFPPDIQSPDEAKEYLAQLRQILIYLGVCDGRLEEGSMRCEPNISVRPQGAEKLGTKTELKNLNSFRSVQLGVQFEMRRQIATLEQGGTILQETRGWNEANESSFAMRIKEEENDYRYFPCPDLIPMEFDDPFIDRVAQEIPELPLAKTRRYQDELGLNAYDAGLLISDQDWADFFEKAVTLGGNPKLVCNWMNSDFAKLLNESGQWVAGERERTRVTPTHLVELVKLIESNSISGKMGKEVFAEVFATGKNPQAIVDARGLSQVSDSAAIEAWVQEVLDAHPDVVESYRTGKQGVIGFLVGQVMKRSQGQANPALVQESMRKALEP